MDAPERLRRWRWKQGFTQEEAAREIGTTVRNYQRWEHGKTTPNGPLLLKILEVASVPLEAWQ